MKRGQTGFTVIETLLVLILLAILGFTGYYVYYSQKNTNNSYNNATKTSSGSSTVTSSNKFVFKEIGVQIPLSDTLKGLSYKVYSQGQGSSLLEVTSSDYKPTDSDCANFAQIYKVSGTYDAQANNSAGKSETLLKQFNGFYVAENVPFCVSQENNGNTLVTAFGDAFKNATLVQ